MVIDENGVKHPETVEDAALLRHQHEQREKMWNQKAQREGWARPQFNQGGKSEREWSRLDHVFNKRHPEWSRKEPVKQEPRRASQSIGLYP